jgi:Flp pilus assembly protein TadG
MIAMTAATRRRSGRRGFAITFYAVMLPFVIACVGLAVDAGTIYMIKARLSSAVDAAALAAGRSVNLADTLGAAQTAAISTANQFFAANFPTTTDSHGNTVGYFNTIGSPTVTPTLTQETDSNGNPSGVLDIAVTASATAPTYFMNIFNVHNLTVSATGTASRRGLVLMLVLDISSSMGTGTGSSCAAMATAAQNFVTLFSPYDQIGLVTFDITAHLKDAPSTSRTQLNTDLAAISSSCNSNTNTISALDLGYQEIKAANLPLALNTIVLFTDGSPNGVTANFPARTAADNRWGPALNTSGQPNIGSSYNPPGQSGSTYSISNSCNNGAGFTDSNGDSTNAICDGMPAICTSATPNFFGTIAQWGDQSSYGAGTYGLAPPTDSSTVTVNSTCKYTTASTNMRQFIAYIPNTDYYGNDLVNGVAATSTTGTATGGYVSRKNWLFQTNNLCSPDSSLNPQCRNTGDWWSSHSTVGSASNFFPTGSSYAGYLRPDQPNTVVAASMNGAMSEAYRIRSDTTYHPVIDTIYLTGNSKDSVDHEFLAVIANAPQITALPYDPLSFTPYTNPAYQTGQQTGKYLVTADKTQLTQLFAELASELLRLSH